MQKKEQSIFDNTVKLEKLGSWTIARLPGLAQDKTGSFGGIRVRGTIDGFEITKCFLHPVRGGRFFLAVRTEIRKAIRKKKGDTVHIILYSDHSITEIPIELILCLENEPRLHKIFNSYTDSERKAFVDWIYAAKKEETKIRRIDTMFKKLEKQLTLHDIPKKIKNI